MWHALVDPTDCFGGLPVDVAKDEAQGANFHELFRHGDEQKSLIRWSYAITQVLVRTPFDCMTRKG